ncbi:MAG TPA: glycosyltransferase [Bdellovibrionales bacterium]|nr:glycosyltransferase [Bdellovibrionales bacterium]
MTGLKVALLHDWLTGYRGGEKVLEVICELYPQAPLYTLVHVKGSVPPVIENRPIHTSFLQHMPAAKSKYRHYLPLFPAAAETMGIKGYDLIISTSHAVAKSVRKHGALHWCFIHSPMRYVWDRFDDYFGAELVGRLPSKLFFRPIANALRAYDRATSGRVDHFAANSTFVAERVRKFYGREAEVLFAPTDIGRFGRLERKPEDFYLFFSALVPYKKADHAVRACAELGRKLVVLGKGPELAKLKRLANPKWVQFLETPSDELVNGHYERARALLYPGIEDLGIVPIEASAAGLPVIAFGEGGILDTQTAATAVLYKPQTVEGLKQAILDFESRSQTFSLEAMKQQAAKFSKERFKTRVEDSIARFLATARA